MRTAGFIYTYIEPERYANIEFAPNTVVTKDAAIALCRGKQYRENEKNYAMCAT